MKSTKLIFSAAGIALFAAPVAAESSAANEDRSSKSASASKATKYCIALEKTVGSRLNRKECRTKEDWARQGVDVDKLLNK